MSRKGIATIIIAIIAIVCGFMLQAPEITNEPKYPGAPTDAWCNNDYANRIDINVNNTGGLALTDYQVYVNVSANPINETSLRVYNATSCTLRPHWTENEIGGNSYGVWVNYSAVAASSWTNNTAIYYNNSSASSISDGYDTFNIYDGFEPFDLGILSGYFDLWAEDAYSPVLNTTAKDAFSSIFKDGSTYHMYYSWGTILHATSTDGRNWTVDAINNPVLSPTQGWETGGVGVPMVWKESGMWYMLYRGGSTKKIGLANSTDGISWTKEATNPVLEGTSGQWDDTSLDPWGVMKIGSTYYLWYNTISSPRKTGLATSTDLISWTKDTNNPIFSGEDFFCAFPFKNGSYYYLLITHHVVGEAFSYIDLYRDTNPTFYSANREYMGRVIQPGLLGHDTPCVLTDDIYRNSFSLTSNQLWTYHAVRYVDNWHTGLSTEIDMASALSLRDEVIPIWSSTTSSVTVVDTPTHQGNRSLKQLNNQNFHTIFDSKTTGIISAWMQRDNASEDMNEFAIYLYNDNTLAAVGDFYDFNFRYWNGTFQNTGIAYAVDTWYLMSLEFDTATDKFNFVITNENGTEVIRQDDISFGNAVSDIDKVTFTSSCYADITGYIDDFYIRKYASHEPTAQLTASLPRTNPITITTGNRALFCNWTANTTFSNIATNLTNCTDFFAYNSTTQEWDWYNINRTINADTFIDEHAAIFVHFNATTTVDCNVLTAETTAVPANVRHFTALRETTAKTLTEINTSITSDGCLITDIYAWNSTAAAYTNTGSYSVLPNEGVAIYATTGCTWDGSV